MFPSHPPSSQNQQQHRTHGVFLRLLIFSCLASLSLCALPTGVYDFESAISILPCAEKITILPEGVTDSVVNASALIVNDNQACQGNPLRYKNEVTNILSPFRGAELISMGAQSELTCGGITFDESTTFYFFKFPTIRTLKELTNSSKGLFGSDFFSPDDEEEKQLQQTPEDSSMMTVTPVPTPSPLPSRDAGLKFLGNVFYLTESRCIWIRTADVEAAAQQTVVDDEPADGENDDGEVNPMVSASPESDDGSACFPASASVTMGEGRTTVSIDKLRIGDVVQTGEGGRSSAVFAWTHRQHPGAGNNNNNNNSQAGRFYKGLWRWSSTKTMQRRQYTYVRLHTRLEKPLVVTPLHYVYVYVFDDDDESDTHRKQPQRQTRQAGTVRPGDHLIAAHDGSPLPVTEVDFVRYDGGLYNPQTVDGDLVVDGIVVSTYTTAVEPNMAHALLTPVRAMFMALRTCLMMPTSPNKV